MRAAITIGVVLLLLIGADALARTIAEREAADRLETALDLADGADVSLDGWPFMLHLLGGEFTSATVSVDHTTTHGLELSDVAVEVDDVAFSVFSPRGEVETEGGKGRAELSADAINAALSREGVDAQVTLRGGQATVTSLELGAEVPAEVEIRGDSLAIVAPEGAGTFELELPQFADDFSYESVAIDGDVAVVRFRIGPGVLTAQ